MGKVKRLELWWQLYRMSLPVWDLENFRSMDFCWHECKMNVSLHRPLCYILLSMDCLAWNINRRGHFWDSIYPNRFWALLPQARQQGGITSDFYPWRNVFGSRIQTIRSNSLRGYPSFPWVQIRIQLENSFLFHTSAGSLTHCSDRPQVDGWITEDSIPDEGGYLPLRHPVQTAFRFRWPLP